MAWEREGDWGDEGGAYKDPEPRGPRVVRAEPAGCPFCGGLVERGELVWRDDPLNWQPEGTRRWWRLQRLAYGSWGFGWGRVPAHRCRSCARLWFDTRLL